MRVFRLHIRPKGGLGNPKVSFAYCLENGLLGMGWPVGADVRKSLSWEDYLSAAIEIYGAKELSRVRYFHDQVRTGDLIWTRNSLGQYFLCRATSDWQYMETLKGRDADIVNFVRCEVHQVPAVDDVPGKIVACFRATRTIQSIANRSAVFYSKVLWNALNKSTDFEVSQAELDPFAVIGAEAVEDLVFVLLQLEGWIVVPHSRKADTMAYEYFIINKDTGRRGVVQIKTGDTLLYPDNWKDRPEQVILFQTNNRYVGNVPQNVRCLDREEVLSTVKRWRQFMPRSAMRWIDWIERQ